MEKLWYMGVIARTNGACRCDLMYWTWKSRWVIMVFSRRLNYSQKATFTNSKAYIWAYRAVFNYLYLFFVSRNTAYPALQMQSLLQIFHNALLLLNMLSLSHNVPGCYLFDACLQSMKLLLWFHYYSPFSCFCIIFIYLSAVYTI